MNAEASKEARRIRDELPQIATIVSQAQRDWREFVRTGDDAYLKATAYDLHGFYTGNEKVLESVAGTIDDRVPRGENWHRALLRQMCEEISGVRPALFSSEAGDLLDEFLRFRHRIRNIYSFNLVPEKVQDLVERLPAALERIGEELSDFALFLEQAKEDVVT